MLSAYFCTIALQPCPAALRALARQPCARCCPEKSKQVQQNLRALQSRQVRTGSAEYYTILHHAFMSGFTVHNSVSEECSKSEDIQKECCSDLQVTKLHTRAISRRVGRQPP
jgi:hypothetical protein